MGGYWKVLEEEGEGSTLAAGEGAAEGEGPQPRAQAVWSVAVAHPMRQVPQPESEDMSDMTALILSEASARPLSSSQEQAPVPEMGG